MNSAIPALIDRLVAIGQAAYGDDSPVDVRDGPVATFEDTGQQLWVGGNDDPDADDEAASSDIEWPYAGHSFTREVGATVHCMALAWTGDDDFKTPRDQAFSMMETFLAAVVADPTLDGTVLDATAPAQGITLSQGFNQAGAIVVRLRFDIVTRTQFQH